jgi:hypothetical protein
LKNQLDVERDIRRRPMTFNVEDSGTRVLELRNVEHGLSCYGNDRLANGTLMSQGVMLYGRELSRFAGCRNIRVVVLGNK